MVTQADFELLKGRLTEKLSSTAPGQCRIWRGAISVSGGVAYGMMRVRYPGQASSKPVGVHRVSYMVFNLTFLMQR